MCEAVEQDDFIRILGIYLAAIRQVDSVEARFTIVGQRNGHSSQGAAQTWQADKG